MKTAGAHSLARLSLPFPQASGILAVMTLSIRPREKQASTHSVARQGRRQLDKLAFSSNKKAFVLPFVSYVRIRISFIIGLQF